LGIDCPSGAISSIGFGLCHIVNVTYRRIVGFGVGLDIRTRIRRPACRSSDCARAGLMMSTPADWLMAVVLARQKSLG
jgi:hypothetical protein